MSSSLFAVFSLACLLAACTSAANTGSKSSADAGSKPPVQDAGSVTGDAAPADASATDAASSDAASTDGSTPATGGITVPASITAQVGQTSITAVAYFAGFGGAQHFGRGGLATSPGGTPSLITDCRLTVSATELKLEGGGKTISAPLISSNPNTKTQAIAYPDAAKLGGSETLLFYDVSGAGLNLGVYAGRVISVGGNQPGASLSCGAEYASDGTTDRSLDTLKLSAATIAAFTTKAGTNPVYMQTNIAPSDLGGAAGTALLGRGVLTTNGMASFVYDCKAEVTGGAITVLGGTLAQTATLTGAASDTLQIVTTQGHPAQLTFMPGNNGKVNLQLNGFGFVAQVQARAADGSTLSCPK